MSDTTAGLCECGCGTATLPARHTDTRRGTVRGQPQRFIHGHSLTQGSGTLNPRWKGGRKISGDGYVLLYCPGHPRAAKNYVLEHIIVVERALGRYLRGTEEVHHVDLVRSNNDPSNLVLCPNHAYHMLLHRRQKALAKRYEEISA